MVEKTLEHKRELPDRVVGCLWCAGAKRLGPLKEPGVQIVTDWAQSNVETSASINRETQLSFLRVEIKNHRDSWAHKLAKQASENMQPTKCETKNMLERKVAEQHKSTEKIFRTEYHLAKHNRPFTDHEHLIELQQFNGINMGTIQHSRKSANEIINHIAQEMRAAIVKSLVDLDTKLSLLIDESTTVSNKTILVVSINAAINDGKPVFIFFDLVELKSQTADGITLALLQCLKSGGFSEAYLRQNSIALACDGASVMLGKKAGVGAKMTDQLPYLITWHCMNHWLELAVGDAVSVVTAINHFKHFWIESTVYTTSRQKTNANCKLVLSS